MSDHDSGQPTRRNGSDHLRQYAPWLAAIILGAGSALASHTITRDEVALLRSRVEQQSIAIAVIEGRVERGENDTRAVLDKLDRVSAQVGQLSERFTKFCAAAGHSCAP